MPLRLSFRTFILALLVLSCGPASAKEKPWFVYENAFFEAYSDAPEKKVRRLLEELENFRAAVAQVINIRIPDGATKTQVIIFDSTREFRQITESRLVDAFVIGMRGIPYIVMPEGGAGKWSKIAIRHEYTHVILAYSDFDYPQWYHEGFAEFMSGTTFRSKDTRFTIGESIDRPRADAPWVDWDELLSGDFEFHAEDFGARLSNAYLQSWLLVHYLTLGEDLQYADDLRQYITSYSEGESPDAAFRRIFGVEPAELGKKVIDRYSRRTPYYVISFEPGIQDHKFRRSSVSRADIQPVIDEIHAHFVQARD